MSKVKKIKLSEYILMNGKSREERLKYDFSPSLLEIVERPSHIAGKIIIITITVLIAAIIIWSYFAKLDIVVTGNGGIVSEENVNKIYAAGSGTVKKINAVKGDYVSENDILMEYDTSEIDLEISILDKEIARLQTVKSVLDIYINNDKADVNIESYDKDYRNDINEIIAQNKLYKKQYEQPGVNEEVLKYQYEVKLEEQINATESQLRKYSNELSMQKLYRERMCVKAQVTGYIESTSVNYVGQEILSTEQLYTILPASTEYYFEGYIKDKDISDVEVGDIVNIKLQAYSYSDYGSIKGKVVYISKMAENIEDKGNVYIVKVEIDTKAMNREIELKSGMTGNIEVAIGERTVFDYFVNSIFGKMDGALKEK